MITMDGLDKVKQATAGPEQVKQEAFGPDKFEQAATDNRQGRLNRRRLAQLEGACAGWLLPALDGCQTGISVWGWNFDVVRTI